MNWIATLPTSGWWDLVPATLGGIIGALAGGIVAYVLAVRSSREAREERLEAKRQADAARMFRLFSTLAYILNSLANTILLIRRMYVNASNPTKDRHPKQRVIREIANIEFENFATISPDDLAILFEFDEADFASDLQTIVNQFNGVLSALHKFNIAKREVVDLLMLADEHEIGPDGVVVSKIDNAHRAKLILLEARCESIIAPTLVNLIDVTNTAITAADDYRAVAKRCLPSFARVPGFPSEEIARIRQDLPELVLGL